MALVSIRALHRVRSQCLHCSQVSGNVTLERLACPIAHQAKRAYLRSLLRQVHTGQSMRCALFMRQTETVLKVGPKFGCRAG